MKVLALDNLQKVGIDVFVKEGIEVDVKGKMTPEELAAVINQYDAVVVRGATKATAACFENASRIKVIGRAGSGTDNIDKQAATKKGVVVMNTPGGNTVTTGEHAVAMMMALSRQIPQATASMKAGKWEKNKFMGTELTDKVLGVVGLGAIGKIVADRALGLKMVVVAFDPYVSKEDAARLGVEMATLDELYARADFISYHTPLTSETKGMVNAAAIGKMKDGVRIVNCARGALVNEADLLAALQSGKVKGAALDVYSTEPPPPDLPLLAHPNVVLTPHLGAATTEAQEKVAVLIAEQICDFLKKGTIRNSVNFPSVAGELLPVLKPFLTLAERLGAFHGQLLHEPVQELKVEYSVPDRGGEPRERADGRRGARDQGERVEDPEVGAVRQPPEGHRGDRGGGVLRGRNRVRRGAQDRPDRRLRHRGGALGRHPDAAEPGRPRRGRPDRDLPRREGDQHRGTAAGQDRSRRDRRVADQRGQRRSRKRPRAAAQAAEHHGRQIPDLLRKEGEPVEKRDRGRRPVGR
ncbi:MAG: D-3-phosphoglycerate dehydrogenase [Deltaproteobacteria bacterium]|nr:D-3-phosphoglycerate dehydrogenase [Deltaproteobacteria bacterium]